MNHAVVDASFTVFGERLPLDHGYALFSAVSRVLPLLHERSTWALHSIHGRRIEPRYLNLDGRSSMRIRLPADEIASLLPLIGCSLDIEGYPLEVGTVRILPLRPAASLWSRFVTIKGFVESDLFLDALKRQLDVLSEGVSLSQTDVSVGPRRVMRIRERKVVGFRVELTGLSAEASIRLQSIGLGGRRHMGAGVLIPS